MEPGTSDASAAQGGRRVLAGELITPVVLGGASWSIGGPDEPAARRTLHAALDAGVQALDSAVAYTTVDEDHHNERVIGRVLAERGGDRPLVVTKCGHHRSGLDEWGVDGRPETLAAQCRGSLAALGTDVLDVYLLHRPDPRVPVAESVGALVDLRAEGLVRHVGVSNVDAHQLAEAESVTGLAAVENRLSPFDLSDADLARRCARAGTAFLAYSPLGGAGALSSAAPGVRAVVDVARAHGCSPQQLLLAWLLRAFPAALAVVGARRPETITDSLRAPALQLSQEDWARVDDLVAGLAPAGEEGTAAAGS